MTKTSVGLQDLQRKIYVKAKTEAAHRFWGLYGHVCKEETLFEAYRLVKANKGAPGVDGVTFADIEACGLERFLTELRSELISGRYAPQRNRKVEIPKGNGKTRTLGIPTIRDRVVQGALKLILEPIFEADFQSGSYGYRPGRTAIQAADRVSEAIVVGKTLVLDLDLSNFFDNVRHHLVLSQVARRVSDPEILRLLKQMLKASGKMGVPQGGVISPLLSNLYLTSVDRMLEKAKSVLMHGKVRSHVEYVRYADDLVILVERCRCPGFKFFEALPKRLREEFDKLGVSVNEEKSREVDLAKGESFGFVGFDFRRVRSLKGRWRPNRSPKLKKRTELLGKLKTIFRAHRSQPVFRVIDEINPILSGWVQYFRYGHSASCFDYIRGWVAEKIRRHVQRQSKRRGLGWRGWTNGRIRWTFGVFDDFQTLTPRPGTRDLPAHTVP
jgi:RNA-directed DNA polymerase